MQRLDVDVSCERVGGGRACCCPRRARGSDHGHRLQQHLLFDVHCVPGGDYTCSPHMHCRPAIGRSHPGAADSVRLTTMPSDLKTNTTSDKFKNLVFTKVVSLWAERLKGWNIPHCAWVAAFNLRCADVLASAFVRRDAAGMLHQGAQNPPSPASTATLTYTAQCSRALTAPALQLTEIAPLYVSKHAATPLRYASHSCHHCGCDAPRGASRACAACCLFSRDRRATAQT